MAAKRGRGRPPLGKDARTVNVTIRANEPQRARWREAAEVVGEKISTFLATAGDERAARIKRRKT
jgi:uncharacterized protein (DUF1778 family)